MKHIHVPGPISCRSVEMESGVQLYYTGPDLSEGPLPAFFYFALAGDESLTLDPFNQIIAFLHDAPIRCWSLTIPGHGPGYDKTQAIYYLFEQMRLENDVMGDFLEVCKEAITWTIDKGYTDPERIAAGGLSRGGFVATHLAARDERIRSVLGLSPLTYLKYHPEFAACEHSLIAQEMDVDSLIPRLIHRQIRYYIGNRDQRVLTDYCFQFVRRLVDAAFEQKVRVPQIELFIGPSIGYQGHGTPPEVFFEGAKWIRERLA